MNGPHTVMTKIEAMVQPDRIGDGFFWVSATLVCIHPSIPPFHDSLLGKTIRLDSDHSRAFCYFSCRIITYI